MSDVSPRPTPAMLRHMLKSAFRAGIHASGLPAEEIRRRERLVSAWSPEFVRQDNEKKGRPPHLRLVQTPNSKE